MLLEKLVSSYKSQSNMILFSSLSLARLGVFKKFLLVFNFISLTKEFIDERDGREGEGRNTEIGMHW
jgi:hypothetical protein